MAIFGYTNINNREMAAPKSILFVCLGNICRSPAAEGVFGHFVDNSPLKGEIKIDSAGTYGGHAGEKADRRMRSAAQKRGYNLLSLSRQVKNDDFDNFDLIIAMDDSNYYNLTRLAPSVEAARKIEKFASYITKFDIDHVPDPYYEGAEGFEFVLDILEDGCKTLLSKISSTTK